MFHSWLHIGIAVNTEFFLNKHERYYGPGGTRLLTYLLYYNAYGKPRLHKTVVTCKIKHLQKCFRAVDFPRLCRGRKNVVKKFYFTCNHLLSSTCVQHAKTFTKHLQKCFSVLFYIFYIYANVLQMLYDGYM